jgi:hypothetical protein
MAMRAAMHRAGASALSQLLRGDPTGPDECEVLCPCGHKARYREMRARRVLTAVGHVELLRAWYLCPHCHNGQCPADAVLDIEKTDLSRVSAACWRWLARKRHSTMDGSRSNCWPALK